MGPLVWLFYVKKFLSYLYMLHLISITCDKILICDKYFTGGTFLNKCNSKMISITSPVSENESQKNC